MFKELTEDDSPFFKIARYYVRDEIEAEVTAEQIIRELENEL